MDITDCLKIIRTQKYKMYTDKTTLKDGRLNS
jgi:hypothetical protein